MDNFIGFLIIAVLIAAWFTHIAWCIIHAAYGLLIAGAIFFPIGIFHGIWLWF